MISLGQQSYIEQIIAQFGLQNAQIAITSMEPHINLAPNSVSGLPKLLTPKEKTL